MNLISLRLAFLSLTTIFSLTIVFHILVVTGVIPYGIVWGGRLGNLEEMLMFESVSIVLNLLMVLAVLWHYGVIGSGPSKATRLLMWGMCILFLINTIGNAFSLNRFEAAIFTPMTLIISILCMRLTINQE